MATGRGKARGRGSSQVKQRGGKSSSAKKRYTVEDVIERVTNESRILMMKN